MWMDVGPGEIGTKPGTACKCMLPGGEIPHLKATLGIDVIAFFGTGWVSGQVLEIGLIDLAITPRDLGPPRTSAHPSPHDRPPRHPPHRNQWDHQWLQRHLYFVRGPPVGDEGGGGGDGAREERCRGDRRINLVGEPGGG